MAREKERRIQQDVFPNAFFKYFHFPYRFYREIARHSISAMGEAVFSRLIRHKTILKREAPTRASLALELGTSMSSISKAFKELRDAGLIEAVAAKQECYGNDLRYFNIPIFDSLPRRFPRKDFDDGYEKHERDEMDVEGDSRWGNAPRYFMGHKYDFDD